MCIPHQTNYDPFIDASKIYFSSCHTKAKLINSGKYYNKCEIQGRNGITTYTVSSSYNLINTIEISVTTNDINDDNINIYLFVLF